MISRTAVFAILLEHLLDLVANLTVGNLDIVLGAAAVVVHQRQEAIIGNIKLFVLSMFPHLDLRLLLPAGIPCA
jgi:hypothetical protein